MDSEYSAVEEAKRHLNRQIDSSQNQAIEAIEVTKINLLIFSILVGAVQISGDPPTGFYLAGLPLMVSIVISTTGYLLVNPTLGLNHEGIHKLTKEDSVEEFLPQVYGNWIKENHRRYTRIHILLLVSLGLTAVSLGAITGLLLFG